jgi:alkaline phosphatase/alkaline phosphatase D
MYKLFLYGLFILFFQFYSCTSVKNTTPKINSNFVLLAGELSATSILLQCRLASTDSLVLNDVPGINGIALFQLAKDSLFIDKVESDWMESRKQSDFIIKNKFNGLESSTNYYYRVKAVLNGNRDTVYSRKGSFKTFPTKDAEEEVSFAMSTGFNYESFYGIGKGENESPKTIQKIPASGIDHKMGFEAFEAVQALKVNFFIANGDIVYYDKPNNIENLWAKDKDQMRAKWHRYFAMPRNRNLALSTPVYYLKDDHDYRFNDSDTTDIKFSEPSHRLGIEIFREQVPVTDPMDPSSQTYRSHRVGKHLQLWFLEGRDFRSPNAMKDDAEKTLWGKEQLEWLKESILSSDAAFKIIVSPTPMIGPDDAYKKDNHTNPGGFQSEGKAFFRWLTEHNFSGNDVYFICGDRHWQYHSIHPTNFEEFSSGAFINQNARSGRIPGDPKSTDPEELLKVPYIQIKKYGGGFLHVKSSIDKGDPFLRFSFFDTVGNELYSVKKYKNIRNQ